MIGPKIATIIDDLTTRLRRITALRQELADTTLHLDLLIDAIDTTEDDIERLQADLLRIIDDPAQPNTITGTDGITDHIDALCRRT